MSGRQQSGGPRGGLGVRGWARWAWRQLTSMRVAIMLLLALALVSLPGSFLPQRGQDPVAVAQYLEANPGIGPWLERAGLFDVYTSPWFSAVYLLLFVSLIGCIVPRTAQYVRVLRQGPSPVPRRLGRFPAHAEATSPDTPGAVVDRVVRGERRRGLPGLRAAVRRDGDAVSIETGRSHEAGNLLFHIALVGVLLAFAAGQLVSYRGQALVVAGESFANSVLDYDSFSSGAFVAPEDLEPFTLRLHDFTSRFTPDGQPREFSAQVTTRTGRDAQPATSTIAPNHPLDLDDTRVYLSGNGYAPVLTLRDAAGQVVLSGPVPFLPQDAAYISRGVVKAPDTTDGQAQLGLVGVLLPTAVPGPDNSLSSAHPAPDNPALVLQVWEGDLGLDDGVPQNVYQLDTDAMTQVTGDAGAAVNLVVAEGQTVELPGGRGSLTYESTERFASFDLRHDPTLGWLAATSLTAFAGLMISLGVTRRRLWVRVTARSDGGSDIEVAGLARGEDIGLADAVARVRETALGRAPSGGSGSVGAQAGSRPAGRTTTVPGRRRTTPRAEEENAR